MQIITTTRCSAGLAWLALFATTSQAQAPTPPSTPAPPLPICRGYKPRSYYVDKDVKIKGWEEQLEILEAYGITPWYTDSDKDTGRDAMLDQMRTCGNDHRIPLIVYGMPNKACDFHTTPPGDNAKTVYTLFTTRLAEFYKEKNMLYIVEPGALSLIARGKCGVQYKEPLVAGLKELSKNQTSEIYLDVQYSTLTIEAERKAAVDWIQSIPTTPDIRLNGFALNTADYKTTDEMTKLCTDFISAFAEPHKSRFKCIIDTSRNGKPPTGTQQCNMNGAGIGFPPEVRDGKPVAYYLWNKPPGESDGKCLDFKTNMTLSNAVANVTEAGIFSPEHFKSLWENGFFVTGNKKNRNDALTHLNEYIVCGAGKHCLPTAVQSIVQTVTTIQKVITEAKATPAPTEEEDDRPASAKAPDLSP